MTEQRNFRSAYLEKVGIKGVEEKKSLEILLKEQPLDIIKLNQFCIRFPVPASYRPYLWKVLLGTIDLIIAQCLTVNKLQKKICVINKIQCKELQRKLLHTMLLKVQYCLYRPGK